MVKLIGGGTDLNTVVSDMNTNLLELKNNEVVQYFKDEAGIRRVLLGKGAGGFYGLKVSQPDIDVYTATDSQLVFNSQNNLFKITTAGTTTLTVPTATGGPTAGVGTKTIAHNGASRPSVVAFADITGSFNSNGSVHLPKYVLASHSSVSGAYVIVQSVEFTVDDTNITFKGLNYVSPGFTAAIRYYIIQETSN